MASKSTANKMQLEYVWNHSTDLPKDIAAETGLSQAEVKRIISRMSPTPIAPNPPETQDGNSTNLFGNNKRAKNNQGNAIVATMASSMAADEARKNAKRELPDYMTTCKKPKT